MSKQEKNHSIKSYCSIKKGQGTDPEEENDFKTSTSLEEKCGFDKNSPRIPGGHEVCVFKVFKCF